MSETNDAGLDYQALRQSATSVQLATIDRNHRPQASYAPCVWYQGDCYLYLSALSAHSANLENNPAVSLLLLEAEAPVNAFARKRASLQGSAFVVGRDEDSFGRIMPLFHQSFGKVMQLIEPLPDFRLFRIRLEGGRFVRGFGQAYRLCGDRLDRLEPIGPEN